MVLDVPGKCLEVRKRGKYVAQLFITDGVIITDRHCFDVSRRCSSASRVERVTSRLGGACGIRED